jgi:hypothetical protein
VICPNCGAEYQPGFTRCSDCDVELVADLPEPHEHSQPAADPVPARPEPHLDPSERFGLVTVLSTIDPGLIAVAGSLLRSAGIPFVSEGDAIVDLFGWGRLGGCNSITGLPRLRVAPQDADDARALLADPGTADDVVDRDDVVNS